MSCTLTLRPACSSPGLWKCTALQTVLRDRSQARCRFLNKVLAPLWFVTLAEDAGAAVAEVVRDVTSRLGELAFAAVQVFGAAACEHIVGAWEARTGTSLLFGGAVASRTTRQAAAASKKVDNVTATLLAFLG